MVDWPEVALWRSTQFGKATLQTVPSHAGLPNNRESEIYVSLSKVRERLANPEFLRAVKEKLPPGVRPSTIDLSMALHMALAAAFPAEPGEEEGG